MFQKQSFEHNIYMKLFRWAYILLMGNLCFLVVNIPFFLAAICLAIDVRNLPTFLLSLLTAGPGMIALFGMIDTFKEEKDVEPVKVFFQKLKMFGLRGLLYWLIGWFGLVVGISDMVFFAKLPNGQWLIPFFLLVLLLAVSCSLTAWYFQIRNPQAAVKDVLRIAFYYTVRKWYASVLNVFLFGLLFVLMVLKPQFGFVLTPILFAGLIYLNNLQLYKLKAVKE